MIFKHPTKNGWKKIKESIKEKIRQVEELQITKQELGKVIMKRKHWSDGNRRDIKFLVENTEINVGKTSNSNGGIEDRGPKQGTKMANARKDGAYAQDRRFVKWKGLQTY